MLKKNKLYIISVLFLIIPTVYILNNSIRLFTVFIGIIALIILVTKLNVEPFISILLISIIMGLVLGLSPIEIIDSIEKGNGALLGHLSLILGLGAMLGTLLNTSKAAEITATRLIDFFGVKGIQWVLIVAGMCISFSLFFDVAFILIIPIVLNIAKHLNVNKLWLALPTGISILTIHALFPPHPSPSIIVKSFNLQITEVMYYGLIVAIPTVILGGIFLTNIMINNSSKINNNYSKLSKENNISFLASTTIILLPILLITLPSVIIKFFTFSKDIERLLNLIGNPVTALLITLIIAIIKLGIMQGQKISQISNNLSLSAKGIATILLINGAAGGLKQILIDAKITDEVIKLTSKFNISVLLISFIVAAMLRIALGSSTVSAITILAVIQPKLFYGISYA